MAKNKKKLKKRIFHGRTKYEYQDIIFKYFGLACTMLGIVVLALLMYNIISSGISRISWDFIMNGPSRMASKSGIFTAWVGTLWIMVLTSFIAFPIGIGAALYLEEYNKKSTLANIIEINIANLAGVPSIIYGLLGLELFARAFGLGESVLTGALTLSLLILPIIIVSTREALKSVPYSIREASYALGASKWQTIWNQVLPASIGGIFTGVILSLSRAIGETAPLLVIGALLFVPHPPEGIMDSERAFSENAAAAIIILLGITFFMNGIGVYIRHTWQKKIKW
jgi:phosphate transport system permease protein